MSLSRRSKAIRQAGAGSPPPVKRGMGGGDEGLNQFCLLNDVPPSSQWRSYRNIQPLLKGIVAAAAAAAAEWVCALGSRAAAC